MRGKRDSWVRQEAGAESQIKTGGKQMQIVNLPLSALTPYEKNTRKHTEKDIEKIVESIERYGFSDPIGIWGENNIIVEGHGRMLAADLLGMDEVPCIRLDHMSDEQRREYAIAHNRTAEFSEWDFDNLQEELKDLNFEDFDLEFDFIEDETEKERESIELNETISVVVDCETEIEAEELFEKLKAEGYECRISTL